MNNIELLSGDVTINNSEENANFATDLLTTKVYERPLDAIFREYIANAYDSQVEAGTDFTKHPVEVTLPTSYNNYTYVVQDFGLGLSRDEVVNFFISPISSTKRKSKKATGHIGIGAKAAHAKAKSFIVESNYNGMRTIVNIFKKESSGKGYQELFYGETTEPNGVKVIIPLDEEIGIEKADRLIKQLTQYWPTDTIKIKYANDDNAYAYTNQSFIKKCIESVDIKPPYINIQPIHFPKNDNEDFDIYLSTNQLQTVILMGHITYKLPHKIYEQLLNYKENVKLHEETINNLIISVPNKTFTPLPSRENIVIDEKSLKLLDHYITKAQEKIIEHNQNLLDNSNSDTREKLSEVLQSLIHTKQNSYSSYTYKGYKLNIPSDNNTHIISIYKESSSLKTSWGSTRYVFGSGENPIFNNLYRYPKIIIINSEDESKTKSDISYIINRSDLIKNKSPEITKLFCEIKKTSTWTSMNILIRENEAEDYEKVLPETIFIDAREIIQLRKEIYKIAREEQKNKLVANKENLEARQLQLGYIQEARELEDYEKIELSLIAETLSNINKRITPKNKDLTLFSNLTIKHSENKNEYEWLESQITYDAIIETKPDMVYIIPNDCEINKKVFFGPKQGRIIIFTTKIKTLENKLTTDNIKFITVKGKYNYSPEVIITSELNRLPLNIRKLITPTLTDRTQKFEGSLFGGRSYMGSNNRHNYIEHIISKLTVISRFAQLSTEISNKKIKLKVIQDLIDNFAYIPISRSDYSDANLKISHYGLGMTTRFFNNFYTKDSLLNLLNTNVIDYSDYIAKNKEEAKPLADFFITNFNKLKFIK